MYIYIYIYSFKGGLKAKREGVNLKRLEDLVSLKITDF